MQVSDCLDRKYKVDLGHQLIPVYVLYLMGFNVKCLTLCLPNTTYTMYT